MRCGTSDRYYEEVRAVSIIPGGSQAESGTPIQVLDRGYASFRERSQQANFSENTPSTSLGE
jgi:hypothetical protein